MSVSRGGEEMRKMLEEETQRARKCAGLEVGSKDYVLCIVSIIWIILLEWQRVFISSLWVLK